MRKSLLLSLFSIIVILTSCKKDTKPVASFSMNKTTCTIGETVTFTNSSERASFYLWNFGDGTSLTTENPTHSYSSAGTFTIKLYAGNEEGIDAATKEITVTL